MTRPSLVSSLFLADAWTLFIATMIIASVAEAGNSPSMGTANAIAPSVAPFGDK
jgi:hypothetical protein